MKRWSLPAAIICAAMLDGVVLCQAPPEAGGGGFVAIFNGKDLTGWVVDGRKSYEEDGEEKPVWAVEEGMIVCRGRGGGFLRYDRKLKDFIVRLEYRMSKRCNSGLGIRGVVYTGEDSTRPSRAGYEIQISDDAGRDPGKRSSGSLYRYVAPKVNASKPADEWNAIEVECRGPRIRVTLNEQVIHDLDQTTIEEIKDKPLAGYFSVQNHGKLIDFRNIKLKEL